MARGGKYFGWILLGLGLAWAAKEEKRVQDRNARWNESARRAREDRLRESRANIEAGRKAEEERLRPYREREELRARVNRVEELFHRRPDLREQWDQYLHDRFGPPAGVRPIVPVRGKSTGFRGPSGDVLADPATGDRFEITGGDVADGWYTGTIRAGQGGETRRFTFYIGRNDIRVDTPLDDASMAALARLFNAASGRWQFASLAGPVSVTRPKAEYYGPENEQRRREAKAAFGERYL